MKNDQDIFLVIILLVIDNFLLGAGFDFTINFSMYLSFFLLLPRFLRMLLTKNLYLLLVQYLVFVQCYQFL